MTSSVSTPSGPSLAAPAGEPSGAPRSGTTERLVDTLEDIGFASEAVTTSRKRQVLLHLCPFREATAQHREIVCSVHLA